MSSKSAMTFMHLKFGSPKLIHKARDLPQQTHTTAVTAKTRTNPARVATMRRKWRPVALIYTDSEAKVSLSMKNDER